MRDCSPCDMLLDGLQALRAVRSLMGEADHDSAQQLQQAKASEYYCLFDLIVEKLEDGFEGLRRQREKDRMEALSKRFRTPKPTA